MFSSRYNFIYIHVPKTGGNSLQTAFLPLSDDKKTVAEGFSGRDRFGLKGEVTPSKHAKLREYAARLGPKLEKCLLSASVRHPFDRLVFFDFSPHRWESSEDPSDLRSPVFDERAFLDLARSLDTMTSFVELSDGLPTTLFLLRYETLAQDFQAFMKRIGAAEHESVLPHVNKSAAQQDQIAKVRASRELRRLTEPFLRRDLAAFAYDLAD